MDIQSPIYLLHVFYFKDNTDKIKQRCYIQGIPMSHMKLENVESFKIERLHIYNSHSARFESLTKYFCAFQHHCRNFVNLLRRVRNPRFILDRERLGPLRHLLWLPPMVVLLNGV